MVTSILIAVVAPTGSLFSQESNGRRNGGSRITLTWSDDVTPQVVIDEIACWGSKGYYGGGGGGSYSGQTKQLVYDAPCGGHPVRHVKIAIYASGCKSQKFDLDPKGSDVTKKLQCDPLPNVTIRGFVPPDEMPRVLLDQGPVLRQLNIFGELETGWMSDFLLGASNRHVEHIKLGTIGVLDPAGNGEFEITLPDFSRDPSFSSYAASGRTYGIVKLTLGSFGTLVPLDSLEPGIRIEGEYPYGVVFRVLR